MCNLAKGFDLDFLDLIQKHIRLCGDSLEHSLFLEADAATGSTGGRNDERAKMPGFLMDLFRQGRGVHISMYDICIFFLLAHCYSCKQTCAFHRHMYMHFACAPLHDTSSYHV